MAIAVKNKGTGSAAGWMKKGSAAKNALQKEEAIAEQKKDEQGKLRRFWVPVDGESTITFLDGNLDAEGMLDNPIFYEHQVNMNGSWKNWFLCTQDEEPCPVCEGGSDPYLAGVFTVIDHNEYKASNGKVYKDQKRLFVAKRGTLKVLQKLAAKRDGLAGCTFTVSRSNDKSAGVGDLFDFEQKRTPKQLLDTYGAEACTPANYEEEFKYRTAKELRAIGFGTMVPGSEPMMSGTDSSDESDAEQYDKDL